MKWHTFNRRPDRLPRFWMPRKTLGTETPGQPAEATSPLRRPDRQPSPWVPRKTVAAGPAAPPPKARGPLLRFLEEHQRLLLILGVIIPCAAPMAVTAKVGLSAAQRRWLHQEAEIEEPEPAPAPTTEAARVEVRKDTLQQDVRQLLRTLGNAEFESPEDVATGRFLMVLDQGVQLIRGCDLERIRLIGRDRDWARIEAIYRPLQLQASGETAPEKYLLLELVEEESRWKVEHLRMTSRRFR